MLERKGTEVRKMAQICCGKGRKPFEKKKDKAITFRVTEEFNEYLKKIADLDDKSIANCIVSAVMEYGEKSFGLKYDPVLHSEIKNKNEWEYNYYVKVADRKKQEEEDNDEQ